MTQAIVAMQSGNVSGKSGALGHLDVAERISGSLPSWTRSVIDVRRAFLLIRESRYREATLCLRRVDTAAHMGLAHPAALNRSQLVRAKLRYDQGRYAEAERYLATPSGEDPFHCPHRLNMQALITGRKFLEGDTPDASALLAETLSLLTESLGFVFLWHGDTSLLDGLCYNIGNNLLRGIQRGVVPVSCADMVTQWLGANMLVCRKLGVGEDSVLANLLLIDVGLNYGYAPGQWPDSLRSGLTNFSDLECLLSSTLAQARQFGNPFEVAQCLRRQVRMKKSADDAQDAYLEGLELFRAIGRKDVVNKMRDEWRVRFGKAPSRMHGQ